MSRGKVYGFIGPVQGGKSYQLNELRKSAIEQNVKFINADFSDGIRQTALNIFGTTDCDMNVLSSVYANWKNDYQKISIPVGSSLVTSPIRGRDILKNIGEGLKKLAGDDVWARWTGNDIYRKYWSIDNEEERLKSVIAFGSVRFQEEVEMVFTIAKLLNKEVELKFCNYKNEKYDANVHISERLAHGLIIRNFKDGDDVTLAVKEMFKIK